MSSLADRILDLSRDLPRGWQASLAKECNVKPPSVSDWVSGRTKTLKGETLLKAAKFLGVTPTWLATGRGAKYHDQPIYENHAKENIKPFAEPNKDKSAREYEWPFKHITPERWWKELSPDQRSTAEGIVLGHLATITPTMKTAVAKT